MSCKVYKEKLHRYADNELSEIEKSVIAKHLEICPDCSNELAEIKKLRQMLGNLRFQGVQLDAVKQSIMSVIRESKKKVPVYDIKVLTRLGASMIACGLIVLVLNFSSLGDRLEEYSLPISQAMRSTMEKINQPIAFINKGMSNVSDFVFNINGMTFEIEQKIKGGM